MKSFVSSRLLAIATPLLLLLACGGAQASQFQLGDVFAGTAGGTVEHWRTGSGLLASYASGGNSFVTGMTFDGPGNLYVTNFSNGNVSKLAGPADPHTATLFANQGSNPETVVFDKLGNLYVGSASNGDIKKYNSTGTLLQTWNTGFRADWIDLDSANTKIYFTEDVQKGVKILDLGTSAVSTFNGTYGNFALRLLADGGLLVANQGDIKHLDNTGALVMSYDVAGNDNWFALNLDPDGNTFWSADFGTGLIQQFDIATGAQQTTFHSGSAGGPWGLAVFGEITQGGGGTGQQVVPEPGTFALVGLGVAGMILISRKKVAK